MTTSTAPRSYRPPALINALHLTGRKLSDIKVVVNGAGAAGIACLELLKAHGPAERTTHPVRHQRRYLARPHAGMNQWKSAHAVETNARTLDEAMKGATSSSAFR